MKDERKITDIATKSIGQVCYIVESLHERKYVRVKGCGYKLIMQDIHTAIPETTKRKFQIKK